MTPTLAGMKFGAYHRVSNTRTRDTESDSYITEDVAFEQIDYWGKMRRVDTTRRYLDRDVSGSKLRRPDLDRMLDDLRKGVIDGIVVAQVDRLSRADVASALKLVAEIDAIAPGRLVILDLGLDPSTDTGEMVLSVLLALARWQWRRFRTKWGDAQRKAVARGVWIGPAPFGYVKGDTGTLEPDPDTGPIVTEAFRIGAARGLHATMTYLEGAAPERRWRTDEARRLLSCRAYLGEVKHGEHVRAATHTPLTTPARFAAAQTDPRSRRTNGHYPLSGIAECQCGAPMVGALQTAHGRKYRRMRCSDPACRGGSSISADKLEGYIRSELAAALGVPGFRKALATHGVDEAWATLQAAEDERTRYLSDLDARRLAGSDTAWRAGLEARAGAVNAARETYQALASQAERYEALPLPAQLSDSRKLAAALRIAVEHIIVRAGRGDVTERVSIRWQGSDVIPGELAA